MAVVRIETKERKKESQKYYSKRKINKFIPNFPSMSHLKDEGENRIDFMYDGRGEERKMQT